MGCVYYPNHDKRYAHIDPADRWMYPDEIRDGGFWYRRTKPLKDITKEDTGGVLHPLLLANDVPYPEACYDGGSWG